MLRLSFNFLRLAIEVNDEFQDWAVAGETPTITLTGVDMIHFRQVDGGN
jgi:hypothetical protein